MGGRSFDVRNKAIPACVEQLALNPPACFDKPVWRLYLIDCYRSVLDDDAARASISRGICPDFCSECTAGYRASMESAGKCHPPSLTPSTTVPAKSSAWPTHQQELPLIVTKETIRKAYEVQAQTLSHQAALAFVADLYCIDVETVACVLEEEVLA